MDNDGTGKQDSQYDVAVLPDGGQHVRDVHTEWSTVEFSGLLRLLNRDGVRAIGYAKFWPGARMRKSFEI